VILGHSNTVDREDRSEILGYYREDSPLVPSDQPILVVSLCKVSIVSTHKILVIDDSKVIRMKVRDMLPEGNFEILEARDGLEGYHLIRSENPNLIMLDFLLPKMSGWEVYQEIQKEQHLKAIPLVLMSGRKEEVIEKLPEPFEHFAFIEKPFEQRQLLQAIKEAMDKAKKHSTGQPIPTPRPDSPGGDEVQVLKAEVARLRSEMEVMKKQMSQLVNFIKKKLT
jgi:CheY-like chemotaxis protein